MYSLFSVGFHIGPSLFSQSDEAKSSDEVIDVYFEILKFV